jgi:hypothetical protein
MRKVLIALFTVGLLVGGAAFAQNMGTGSNMFGGVSFGVLTEGGAAVFPVAVHFGVSNVGMENLAIRGDAAYWINGNAIEFGVDGLYMYPVMDNVTVYGGLGPRFLLGLGGGSAFGLGIVAGGEYMFTSQIGVTGEGTVEPYFSGGTGVLFGFSAGVNYHF